MPNNSDEHAVSAVAGTPRPRRRRHLIAAIAVAIVCSVAIISYLAVRGPAEPGDEVIAHDGAYGYDASMAVGHVFTDGLTRIHISSKAREPLRLVSARPVEEDGGTLTVLGVRARVVPDMLPPGYTVGGFQEYPGFPATDHNAKGAVPVKGLEVRVPRPGEYLAIQIHIGYKVVAAGRYTRRGVELIYEYEGRQHRVVIPSRVAICSPAKVTCTPNDDEDN